MQLNLLGSAMVLMGILLSATAVPRKSDEDCLKSTRYDTDGDVIRACDDQIPCTDPNNNTCLRRSDSWKDPVSGPMPLTSSESEVAA